MARQPQACQDVVDCMRHGVSSFLRRGSAEVDATLTCGLLSVFLGCFTIMHAVLGQLSKGELDKVRVVLYGGSAVRSAVRRKGCLLIGFGEYGTFCAGPGAGPPHVQAPPTVHPRTC